MATSVVRWDPASELSNMRNAIDRIFGDGFSRFPGFRGVSEIAPETLSLDVYETNDSYVVKASVPGVDPKDVEINVEDDVLTIRGETRQESETQEDNYLRRELRHGSFERSLRLPPTVEAEHASATFENGVLKLTLPKKPEAKARSIRITPTGVISGENGSIKQPAAKQQS